jgi:hypothetical protein
MPAARSRVWRRSRATTRRSYACWVAKGAAARADSGRLPSGQSARPELEASECFYVAIAMVS